MDCYTRAGMAQSLLCHFKLPAKHSLLKILTHAQL